MSNKDKPKGKWYVTNELFANGGKIIKTRSGQILGPWDTRDQALSCRFGFEHGTGCEGELFVDHM